MKDLQQTTQSLLDRLVAENAERGLQVALYLDGQLVVDAFAGKANPGTGQLVDSTTLFPVMSTTKGIEATLAHILVERGKIDYDTPLAEVWPEFAAHGKQGVTLRHALNHTAGLPYIPMGIGRAELYDWTTMCSIMANEKPVSPPGAEQAYHAITYSWLVGEPLRRVDGRSLPQMFHDEIFAPLGVQNEMFIGIPDEVENRVAILEDASDTPPAAETTPQAIPSWVQPLHVWMNQGDARRACIPASNGIVTARSIARHYAALIPSGVDGIELLPPDRVKLALEPPMQQLSPNPPTTQRLGYGFGLPFPAAFGYGGAGGSLGFADSKRRMAFGFTRNRFTSPDTRPLIFDTLNRVLPPIAR